jgi:hypothetical protein
MVGRDLIHEQCDKPKVDNVIEVTIKGVSQHSPGRLA